MLLVSDSNAVNNVFKGISLITIKLKVDQVSYSLWDRSKSGIVKIKYSLVGCVMKEVEVVKDFNELSNYCIEAATSLFDQLKNVNSELCDNDLLNLQTSTSFKFKAF